MPPNGHQACCIKIKADAIQVFTDEPFIVEFSCRRRLGGLFLQARSLDEYGHKHLHSAKGRATDGRQGAGVQEANIRAGGCGSR
jgi:hypothetical protein